MYMNGNDNVYQMRRGAPIGYRVGRPRFMRGLGENKQSQEQSQGQSTTTAVSPTIQQSFTPQISPVFQQSSGGGTQSASTQQIAPGGQSGQGGSASGAPGYMSPSGGGQGAGAAPYPSTYTPSYGAGSDVPGLVDPFGVSRSLDYTALAQQPGAVFQRNSNWPLYVGGALVLAAIVYFVMQQQNSKADAGNS